MKTDFRDKIGYSECLTLKYHEPEEIKTGREKRNERRKLERKNLK